jgi:hypothetical protein
MMYGVPTAENVEPFNAIDPNRVSNGNLRREVEAGAVSPNAATQTETEPVETNNTALDLVEFSPEAIQLASQESNPPQEVAEVTEEAVLAAEAASEADMEIAYEEAAVAAVEETALTTGVGVDVSTATTETALNIETVEAETGIFQTGETVAVGVTPGTPAAETAEAAAAPPGTGTEDQGSAVTTDTFLPKVETAEGTVRNESESPPVAESMRNEEEAIPWQNLEIPFAQENPAPNTPPNSPEAQVADTNASFAPETQQNEQQTVLQNVGSQLAQLVPPSNLLSVVG